MPLSFPRTHLTFWPRKNAPLTAAVESDIVGYTTIQMDAGNWYLLGNPFTALDGSTTFKLNDVYVGTGFQEGDVLYVLNGTTFLPRYWNAKEGKWSTNTLFYIEDTTNYPAKTAVYLKKSSPGAATFAGKVTSMKIEVGSDKGNEWSLTALKYPGEVPLNEFKWDGFAKGDMLYTIAADGTFVSHYWSEANNSWSLNALFPIEDTTPLTIGQGVYLLKKSAGTGTISKDL